MIMTHARRLFGRHGYERTSIAMIARSAGISQGLLYNYFDGKDALLAALIDEVLADAHALFDIADHSDTPSERLPRFIHAAFELVRRHHHVWRLWYGLRMQPAMAGSLGGALSAWTAELRHVLTRYAADAALPNPNLEAELLFALIDGAAQHYVLEPNRYPLADIEGAIIARY
jgi:AcrR family transcriptional regulator